MKQQTLDTLEQLEVSIEQLRKKLEAYDARKIYANKCEANSYVRNAISQLLDIMEDIE
jgi:septation ring formation regulator EzrA